MKKVLIVFATRHGQTRTIAKNLQEQIQKDRLAEVELRELTSSLDGRELGEVDAVIVGGPVYAQRFPRSLRRWFRLHRDELRGKTTAFFTVSMNAADRRLHQRREDDRLLREFFEMAGRVPDYCASFAGALNYLSYNWFIRRMMRKISASAGGPTDVHRDYEMTDWTQVAAFAHDFINSEANSPFLTCHRFRQDEDHDRTSEESKS